MQKYSRPQAPKNSEAALKVGSAELVEVLTSRGKIATVTLGFKLTE